MFYIHPEYKNWFLRCRFVWLVEAELEHQISNYYILTEHNPFLMEYINQKNLTCTCEQDLNKYDCYDCFVLMKPICKEQLKTIKDQCYKKNILFWDINEKYQNYEKFKIPKNYIIDEITESKPFPEYTKNKDRMAKGYIEKYIRSRYQAGKAALFSKIEIETVNRCNNTCSFCPINRNLDTREYQKLEDSLFANIIDQLSELNYSGCIALFSNNEPLLDNRLIAFAQKCKQQLPEAFLYIYTNGILLTTEYLKDLMLYFDFIYINNYNTDAKLNENLKEIQQYLIEQKTPENKVHIHLRNINEVLSTRADSAPNKADCCQVTSTCLLPFSQLSIRSNGKVNLCSNDATGKITMGDLNEQSLVEIWNNDCYQEVRKKLYLSRDMYPCNKCDMLFTILPFEDKGVLQ